MAASGEGGGKDEIKTQFVTREGTYKLMTLSEYSKPNRGTFNGQGNTHVKATFIALNEQSGPSDKICFNIGRELYFYPYKGVRKAADLTKPIDKRIYKGTFPTCHDFNTFTAVADSVMLLVGFTAGQVQLIDPIKKELSKLYNEERLIDKTKVTCIKWIPGSPNQFLVSHGSGQMYVYNEELPAGPTSPHYQTFKQGDAFSVHTCKTKSTRNPLYRWVVGEGSINEFAFSPCARFIAVVSQDGYLRVFNYDSMELVGLMKSYFGGLLCVAWSPDGRYLVTGGEDDLVTVWSVHEKRVVCRGEGHKSWVNVVAFDPYTTSLGDTDGIDFSGSDEDFSHARNNHSLLQETLRASTRSNASKSSRTSGESKLGISGMCYRFGSVGQDTLLCLWDLTEDILRQPMGRHRTSTIISPTTLGSKHNHVGSNSASGGKDNKHVSDGNATLSGSMQNSHHPTTVSTSITHKFATLALGDRSKDKAAQREHKRNHSLGSKSGGDKVSLLKTSSNHVKPVDDSIRLLGTNACPRRDEVAVLEPLVVKKIAHERLTALVFKEECIVTACQEGFVCTWARPGKVGLTQQQPAPPPPQQQTTSSSSAHGVTSPQSPTTAAAAAAAGSTAL